MNTRAERIFDYIFYLSEKYHLKISLHPIVSEHLISDSKLLVFNAHENSYCRYIKSNDNSFQKCLEYQEELFKKKCKDDSFCNTCYAGVQEYIYPFKDSEKIIGFISVGSFKENDKMKYIKKLSHTYCLNQSHLIDFYNDLSDSGLSKKEIDVLINPLCDMLELAYSYIDDPQETNLNGRILNYISLNYRRKLTIEELSQKFFISYSTISHNFKLYNGMSINDYITNLRIKDAKHLLKSTKLTVTEIADVVGFSGVNYFINVFTKHENISPSKYRKNCFVNQEL